MRTIAILTIGVAMVCQADGAEPQKPKPNILWIVAEDVCPDMQCYKNFIPGYAESPVHTPNLDHLAATGAIYARAYSTAPVCSPSRSAFHTGMDQCFLGAQNHRSHRSPHEWCAAFSSTDELLLPPGVKLISQRMHDGGYFTANVVKFPPGAGVSGTGKTDWNFTPPAHPFDSNKWADLKSHQPFYAQVHLMEAHRIFERDPERPVDPASVVLPPYLPDHPVARADWARYLESIQVMDRKVGVILKQLDAEGLADNTVVFFFGDHGRDMPRGKCSLFDGGLHVPLLVRWPGHIAPKTACNAPVSLLDLAPTALSLAELPVPPQMQGQAFLGPGAKRRQCVFAACDRIEACVDRVRSVITDRYQYIHNFMPEHSWMHRRLDNGNHVDCKMNKLGVRIEDYTPPFLLLRELFREGKLTPAQAYICRSPRPKEELYDLQADSYELHNLAGSPAHRQVLADLRTRMNAWLQKIDDKGATPEDPAVLKRVDDFWFGP